MNRISKPPTTLDGLYLETVQGLGRLTRRVRTAEATEVEFEHARALLSTLPLATDEFALAERRASNAAAYYACGERGAAAYELRLLSVGCTDAARLRVLNCQS